MRFFIKATTNIKILFLLFIIAVAGIVLPPGLKAGTGVQFELILRQKPAQIDKYFEITRDTIDVAEGIDFFANIANLNLDIQIEIIDSGSAEFVVHLSTVDITPYTYGKRYKVEYNLPARIENIPGKSGSLYQLLISPRKKVDIDTESCPFRVGSDSQFKSSPSANFDFYFLPNSLADYNWNLIKSYLEADYVQFRNALDITPSSKTVYYLAPCPLTSVKWDKRFGYAIDPGRSRIFSIYSRDYNSAEPILTNMLTLLRLWGYAPPFLVEGMGGYFEFNTYGMKKVKAEGKIPPLGTLITTSGYYAAEPHVAEVVSGSFVKFLADSYGISKVKTIYEKSDDLTLLKNLENIIGRPIDSLETDWLYYVDTITLSRALFDYYAGRAGALSKSDQQIEYYEEMLKYDDSKVDSIDTRKKLYMTYYQVGRYYDAEKGYRSLIKIDSTRPVYWQIIGNLDMINGEYDAAWKAFDSAFTLDTTYASAKLLQAEIMSIRGDTTGAIKMAEKYYSYENSIPAKIEFLLLLGRLYQAKGSNYDSLAAFRSFTDALAWSDEMIKKAPNEPAYKYRAGLALFGLHEYKDADEYLQLAWFTERRAYFLGDILLERGKVNDMLGHREKAIRFYQECLANQSSVRQHELCREYIEKPYGE